MMAEYIDRDALRVELEKINPADFGGWMDWEVHRGASDVLRVVGYTVDEAPAADVVPVVRCKDCQNFYLRRGSCGESIPTCSVWGTTVYHDEFCGRAIREKTR